jgi:hypothetical protein
MNQWIWRGRGVEGLGGGTTIGRKGDDFKLHRRIFADL